MPAPPLDPGDVYLHALANGALFLLASDGRSRLVTLDDAIAITTGCQRAGCRVLAAWDDSAVAVAAVEAVRAAGVTPVAIEAPSPQRWDHGTTALIEAAAVGNQRLLEDLLARGVPVDERDVSGSSALHHAAANDNAAAVDALVAAGAAVDLANHDGFTPLDLAVATRAAAAAARLRALGARPAGADRGAVAFHRAHLVVFFGWLVPPLVLLAVIAASWPPSPWAAALVGLVLGLLAAGGPPLAFWRGGAPVRLEGTTLTIVGLRGRRAIDLTACTLVGLGGSPAPEGVGRARWLLLAHPDGAPVSARTLRRLRVPAEERDALAARVDRLVVVALDGGHRHEVIRPVGDVLTSRGADLSGAVRAHLAVARRRGRGEA